MEDSFDIHRHAAAKMFGVAEKDVINEMRNIAKETNFLRMYTPGKHCEIQNLEALRYLFEYWL